jgi:hypothetical protein
VNKADKDHIVRAIAWGHKHGLTFNGLYYDEELCGRGGATYWIFATQTTENEVIEQAIQQMAEECDAVNFTIMRIPQAWIEEALDAQTPDPDVFSKLRAMVDGTTQDRTLIWPDKRAIHIDPTTSNMLVKAYDACEEPTQLKMRKAANLSADNFQRVVDISWKCVC